MTPTYSTERPEAGAARPVHLFSRRQSKTANPTPAKRHPPGECYGEEEIFAALRDLSDEEIKLIQSVARSRLGNTARPGHVEVEDLFIEAAIRIMGRKRRWKHGVSRCNQFLAVIRSIGNQRFKQADRYTRLNEDVAASPRKSLSALDAQTIVARLKEELRGDAIALNILESMREEMRPRQARQSLGINSKVYWAARKRIRRRAENLPGARCPAARERNK